MAKPKISTIEATLEQGKGIFRLLPAWVPRVFCRPGQRMKLHPDDLYAFGQKRGGIDERWLASTTTADNGPETLPDEGLSRIATDLAEPVYLRDAVKHLKGQLIGKDLWQKYGGWPMFSKFFDNLGPLPHHIHHGPEHARDVGQKTKPEMYFFPSQLNNHGGEFPFTFFGLNPETTQAQLKSCLEKFSQGDNQILDLSRCYKLSLDTGWDVPPGILHAPGSLCTYEPQFASDIFAMYQSVLYGGHRVDEELLWKNTPADKIGDYDYLIEVLDWEKNVNKDFHADHFMAPIAAGDEASMHEQGYLEEWICYKSEVAGAKRLTVQPGKKVYLKEEVAFGFIVLQGHGRCGPHAIEAPTVIRFGQETHDEFFVSDQAAREGVHFENRSPSEPLVLLKHFAEHPRRPQS